MDCSGPDNGWPRRDPALPLRSVLRWKTPGKARFRAVLPVFQAQLSSVDPVNSGPGGQVHVTGIGNGFKTEIDEELADDPMRGPCRWTTTAPAADHRTTI